MEVKIENRKRSIYITEGDIIEDSFTPNKLYLVSFDDFDEDNKVLFKLIPLNGSNQVFDDRELSIDEIKGFIIENRFFHYSKDEYSLHLVEKEKTVE